MSYNMLPQCYSIYVEKELVGKRLKSSKVRVSWQLAFEKEYVVHHVELRHSIVSGKREILIDGQMVFANKSMFSGTFEHNARIAGGHELRITVVDTFEGYIYDLVCDNVQFHKMPRKSLKELEALRGEATTSPVVSVDFASFTGKSSALLDGEAAFKRAVVQPPKQKQEQPNLLDWDLIQVAKPPPPPLQQHQQQFNPFDSQPQYGQYPPPQQQSYQQPSQYDPFGGQASNFDPFSAPPPPPQQQQHYQSPPPAYYQAPAQQHYQVPPPAAPYYQAPPPAQQQYQAPPPAAPYYQAANPFGAPAYQNKQQQPTPYDPFG